MAQPPAHHLLHPCPWPHDSCRVPGVCEHQQAPLGTLPGWACFPGAIQVLGCGMKDTLSSVSDWNNVARAPVDACKQGQGTGTGTGPQRENTALNMA